MDLISLIYTVRDVLTEFEGDTSELAQFVRECANHLNSSKAQNFQDVFAAHVTNYANNGYFVEFGATDGKNISSTWMLEKDYGWTGILAEPNPDRHEALRQNRNCHIDTRCVWTKTGEKLSFSVPEDADLATITSFEACDEHKDKRINSKHIEVETITLHDLLNYHNAPDRISVVVIDTEGSEYDILYNFLSNNFNQDGTTKYNVDSFVIEHNYVQPIREKIYRLMLVNGYQRKFMEVSRWDDFYVRA